MAIFSLVPRDSSPAFQRPRKDSNRVEREGFKRHQFVYRVLYHHLLCRIVGRLCYPSPRHLRFRPMTIRPIDLEPFSQAEKELLWIVRIPVYRSLNFLCSTTLTSPISIRGLRLQFFEDFTVFKSFGRLSYLN